MVTFHDAFAEPLGERMTPEVAEKVNQRRASVVANERIGLLAGKSAAGTLLTRNCKHIANADLLPAMYETLRAEGFQPPLIVTPEEFSDAG
jgi:hypothetical protein